MPSNPVIRVSAFLSLLTCASAAHSVVVWDEGINGDLSNDRLNPNNFALAMGVNSVIATSVAGDREYYHFHLASGMQLSQIVLASWSGIDQLGFIGVQAGSTFTEPPTGTNVANLLGYAHIGPGAGNVGANVLPAMGQGAGSIGFTPPLGGSDYTFWLNQTGANAVTYQLDFVAVPEPATLMLLLGGSALLIRRKRS